MDSTKDKNLAWYHGITSYQWLVLVIASLGWIFDVFEGQIFVASMNEAMKSLLPADTPRGTVDYYNNVALAAFLLGGALGGVLFGMLSDRIGRTKTMIITILVYSGFTCVTALAQTWWQMAALRFLVAMGVGGEWAVASAMVAEVFPQRARARSSSIFHGSSVFGTFLAVAAGYWIVSNPAFGWRWGFLVGALPALLTLWIRWKLREPDKWIEARAVAEKDAAQRTGRVRELFYFAHLRSTLIGVLLAAVGLATFWGVHIYGKDLMRAAAERAYAERLPDYMVADSKPKRVVLEADYAGLAKLLPDDLPPARKLDQLEQVARSIAAVDEPFADDMNEAERQAAVASQFAHQFTLIKRWEMIGMLLVTTGGGLGLFAFGPICEWIGRRGAFLVYHVGAVIIALVLFQWLYDTTAQPLWIALPIFGFLTLGMHAGYAVYFPELYPTRLRGTGGGFCFNAGRILAAPILILHGWMRSDTGLDMSLQSTTSLLSLLFPVAIVLLIFAPETKGRELPK